jgi:hypothetical protein
MRGGGVAGSQPMSTAVHMELKYGNYENLTSYLTFTLLRHRSGAGIGVYSTALSTGLTTIYCNWRISSSPRNSPIFLPHPLVDLLTTYDGDYHE